MTQTEPARANFAQPRSSHVMGLLALFIAVHLAMVVLAGPLNELRAMITGWWRVPE